MKLFSHSADPPVSRRISAWWQGYDLVIPAASADGARRGAHARPPQQHLQRNRFDVDTDMAHLMFGDGANSPINRGFVVPVVTPWLKTGTDRLHMVGQSADWALALANEIRRPSEFITDGKRNVDLARLYRDQMPHPAPPVSIRASDRAFAVTPSTHVPSSLTMICVDVGDSRALTEHCGTFVRRGMQRGDEILILQFRGADGRAETDELPATAGRAGPLEHLSGLEVLESRDISETLQASIRGSFAKWRQAADLAAGYYAAAEMQKALIRLMQRWDRIYRRLDEGTCRYVAVRARKTVMSRPEPV